MKPIFNSLGSNYTLRDAIGVLTSTSSQKYIKELKRQLEQTYKGNAYLFYKGRDAIEYALKTQGIKRGDTILTQAFSCYSIEEAIQRAGAQAVYFDVEKDTIQPSIETLNNALKRAEKPKAVIIQYTLGYSTNIKNIASWCKKNKLLLIEDLAQAAGSQDTNGSALGSYGDCIILSFGRDKIIDAVSGGACIIKTSHTPLEITKNTSAGIVYKDRIYPLLTWIIRNTHNVLIGKVLQKTAVKIGLMSNPIKSEIPEMTNIPPVFAKYVLIQLNKLSENIAHRKKINHIYYKILSDYSYIKTEDIEKGSCLRFPVVLEQPLAIIKELRKHGVYVSDRWYRKPVDCGSLPCQTAYIPGSCPNAEYLAEHVLNLPTHKQITESDARYIAEFIKNNNNL